jgi:hypothetical protein
MTFTEALSAVFNDQRGMAMKATSDQVLLPDADPEDACGFVRTDDNGHGFFWCVCADECRCDHCKEKTR